MLYADIPTTDDLRHLAARRADACVSLYLPTTPITQDAQADRIAFRNLADEALAQLDGRELERGRLDALRENLDDLREDDDFWARQVHGLAVLATADDVRTFRMPVAPVAAAEVSDRFHLKPLVPLLSLGGAVVLALAKKGVRVLEVTPDSVEPLEVPGLPSDFADALGRTQQRDRAPRGRIQGDEGVRVRTRQFARAIDDALRPALRGRADPLILAGVEEVMMAYRSVTSYRHVADGAIQGNVEHLSDREVAAEARTILEGLQEKALTDWLAGFEERRGQDRAADDLSDLARAATHGQVQSLLVDLENPVYGRVDRQEGKVALADARGADTYDVIDELVSRVLEAGGEVLGAAPDRMPDGRRAVAVLRYALTPA